MKKFNLKNMDDLTAFIFVAGWFAFITLLVSYLRSWKQDIIYT